MPTSILKLRTPLICSNVWPTSGTTSSNPTKHTCSWHRFKRGIPVSADMGQYTQSSSWKVKHNNQNHAPYLDINYKAAVSWKAECMLGKTWVCGFAGQEAMQKHPRAHWQIKLVELGANSQRKSPSGGIIFHQSQKGFFLNHSSAQTLQQPVCQAV